MDTVAINEHEIASVKVELAWDDIEGHEGLKRAIEVALVGGHPVAVFANRHSNAGALVKMVAAKAGAWRIPFRAVVYPVCPCGNYGSTHDECNCSAEDIEKHLDKMAVRHADFCIWLESIERPPKGKRYPVERLDAIMNRVKYARDSVQPSADGFDKDAFVEDFCRTMRPTALDLKIAEAVSISIARLDGKKEVESIHIAEALQYGFMSCGIIRSRATVETVEVGQ